MIWPLFVIIAYSLIAGGIAFLTLARHKDQETAPIVVFILVISTIGLPLVGHLVFSAFATILHALGN